MNVFQYICGKVRMRILTADVQRVMLILSHSGVHFEDLQIIDDLTLEFTIYRFAINKIEKKLTPLCQSMGIVKSFGLLHMSGRLLLRPVLCIGFACLIFMTIFLQQRILFIRVHGHQNIPEKLICENAKNGGVYFGVSRRSIQSEQIKNVLLQTIPSLQWVGVNTKGCVAVISVKEKNEAKVEELQIHGISSIVSEQDGVIQEITVTEGTAMCQIGQQITAGQTLISGYTEFENFIAGTHAQGEIIAATNRNLKLLALSEGYTRGDLLRTEQRYSLQFGKNLINLWNNSSISHRNCVRIYDKKPLTLPGGYVLPVSLIEETIYYYELEQYYPEDMRQFEWAGQYADKYLREHIILRKHAVVSEEQTLVGGVYKLNIQYNCLEQIGVRKKEEFIQ